MKQKLCVYLCVWCGGKVRGIECHSLTLRISKHLPPRILSPGMFHGEEEKSVNACCPKVVYHIKLNTLMCLSQFLAHSQHGANGNQSYF